MEKLRLLPNGQLDTRGKHQLKPCPFCGGKAEGSQRWEPECYEPDYYYMGYKVCCVVCLAKITADDEINNSKSRETAKTEAIIAWNRRASNAKARS